MPLADQLVQVGHACLEAGHTFTQPEQPSHLVVLAVPSATALAQAATQIEWAGIRYLTFFEPDDGMGVTVLCTEPLTSDRRRVFRKFSLWTRGFVNTRGPPHERPFTVRSISAINVAMHPDNALPLRVSTEFATQVAAELYGLRATARALPGEYDDNFHLVAETGEQFVLKLMHPMRERGFVEMQCAALQHLAQRAPELALPRVHPILSGEAVASTHGRLVWMLTYLPGKPLAECKPRATETLTQLGEMLGRLTLALADFNHPAAQRELKWDVSRALWVRDHLHHLADPVQRAIVEQFVALYESEVVPALPGLRRSVIYGDANDYNVLTRAERAQLPRIAGLIDFGDMHHSVTVAEVAIAAAYALLDQPDPLAAAAHVLAGYHRVFPLAEAEIAVLFPLIAARLCISVVVSAQRRSLAPEDGYITITERPAWAALEKLAALPPRLAHYTFRAACGLEPVPHAARIVEWLRAQAGTFAPLVAADLESARVFDLSVGSLRLGADPEALAAEPLTQTLFGDLRAAGTSIGIGRYDEARLIYTEPHFASGPNTTDERRTVHLGLDLFAEAGTPVCTPLAGTVHAFGDDTLKQGYGPAIVLRHETGDGVPFFTLYGHLSRESLTGLAVGQRVARGQRLGAIGAASENGEWPPHLHFQILTDTLGLDTAFPGVAFASQRALWLSLSPDPNLIAGVPRERFPVPEPDRAATLAARRARIGGNVRLSYREPVKVVRGWKQFLYDEAGRAFLDVYNNVPLIGHSHPRVVRAAQQQLALLNTNTRYLHDAMTQYAERLTALMPEPLRVCYCLNSASEANELAIRLARTVTQRYDIVVLEHAYYGHTNTLIDLSPYKFDGPGGTGRKPWVHVAPIADDYRGPYKRSDPDAGPKYARHIAEILSDGVRPAAFIAESAPSVGGQIFFPPGYLAAVYEHVRVAGGVCIADEVQVGFGRLGAHFWGFEMQGVVPDIVVLGKPIGNGFPLAAVVTTPAIAAAFDNGMEFFSTFGGNPVACAAGLAVLDVLRDEALPQNAEHVGAYLRTGLSALMSRFPLLGDVRGHGLFLGAELVRDRATLEPAGEEAGYVVNRLRERGILCGTDGPHHNVLKIRPPLCFTERDADLFLSALESVLSEDGVYPAPLSAELPTFSALKS